LDKFSQAVTLAIRILGVIGWNFSQDTGYRGRGSWFSSVPQENCRFNTLYQAIIISYHIVCN
jgi:hypothetical protein